MSFWNTVTDYAKTAAEFVMGHKEFEGDEFTGEYTGGLGLGNVYEFGKNILGSDFVKDAAGSFLTMGDRENIPQIQKAAFRTPEISRTASTVSVAALASMANSTGVNNARLQQALTSARARPTGSTPLQRMVGGSAVNTTLRQGRRTQGLGTTNVARVAAAPAATVRREVTTATTTTTT